MTDLILTQYSGKILGPIAQVLGWIMNGIYLLLANIGIHNIGLTIIVLTLLIYTCMLPLTIQQQKFSKMSQKMSPEIQAVQAKYKNKRDQESMQLMNQETQEIYQKYGVSPAGSCVQLAIQMPILFALYRVIYNVPAYVTSVKNVFNPIVSGIIATDGYQKTMAAFVETMKLTSVKADFTGSNQSVINNYIVDVVYKMNTSGWSELSKSFPDLTDVISNVHQNINHLNYFLGLNISNSPMNIITSSIKSGSYLMVIGAILIPLISYLTQVLNIKLMPQSTAGQSDQMAQQMKTMNRTMPLFSLVMCFTVPVGLGLYWIASALFRSVQQFFINKHLDGIDYDKLLAKNMEKAKKKREKMGIKENQIVNAARMNTKKETNLNSTVSSEEKTEKIQKAYDTAKNANPNSLTARANMVKDFNERNNK